MSKKYKLIKTYPSSPELGKIIDLSTIKTDTLKICGYKNCPFGYWEIFKSDLENNPEFWEEVIEEEYEILSFKNSKKNEFYNRLSNGNYYYESSDNGVSLYSMLNFGYCVANGYFIIHSVKRLSDGEIFTIGDKVDSSIASVGKNKNLIGFKIINDRLKVKFSNLGYYPLSTIVKSKQPLFTTEDGVGLYENDSAYLVYDLGIPYYSTCHKDNNYFSQLYEGIKVFSTKEAAEEYMLMNKPYLSINDVKEAEKSSLFYSKLREIVKSKL